MNDTKNDTSDVRPGERIAKMIARAGLCSRRDAEAWIAEGRVSVNGETLTSPAFNVGPEDDVRVDGQRLGAPERTRLFAFHKPRGLVTTSRDPEGRQTVFEALPEDLPRVVTIGRLDINTEGLLLLTNDGGLARVLELPATGWLRRYRVRAHGEVQQSQLDALRDGVEVEGVQYAGIEARLERAQGSNVWLMMGLREGKNREIKRVLEHLGLQVTRLIRVSFGPFELGDLPEGAVQEIPTRVLRDQLGVRLAKQAHADFDAPVAPRSVPVEPAPIELTPREERPRREFEPRIEPARKEPPKKRKHVSILRAEARAEAAGDRRRIERSATADRKGREVQVERISLANPPAARPKRRRPAEAGGSAPSRGREEGRREFSKPSHGKSEFAPRSEASRGPRGDEKREFSRPPRSSAEGGRAARGEGKREFSRPPRGKSEFAPRSEASRGPRSEEKREFSRPPRARPETGSRSDGARAPHGEGKREFSKPSRGKSEFAPRSEASRGPRGEEKREFSRPPRARPETGSRSEGPRAPRGEGKREFSKPPRGKSEFAPRSEASRGPRGEEKREFSRPPRARPETGSRSEGPRAPRGEGKREFSKPSRDKSEFAPRSDAPRGPRSGPAKPGGPKRPPRGDGPPSRGGRPPKRS